MKKATAAMILPAIVTARQPYLLARALTIGPGVKQNLLARALTIGPGMKRNLLARTLTIGPLLSLLMTTSKL